MMFRPDGQTELDQLLGTSIAEFDIPDAVYAEAVRRYSTLSQWLADHWDGDGAIYPQGSARLGTMAAPIDSSSEYDFDLVSRRDLDKDLTTKQGLKDGVGRDLGSFLATSPEGDPELSEGKRCWTLDYPHEPFHMDILPAIPNPEARPSGILLTDRELARWQSSNPIGFTEWFEARMRAEMASLREAVAKRMDVEEAPPSVLKTTLQRSVQALKRHRDLHFAGTSDNGPASIIITTLAGRAYQGAGSVYEVLLDVTSRMPQLLERRNGVIWIPNPVQPDENFADRWDGHPDRAEAFFRWIEAAQDDFAGLGRERGLDQVIEKLAESFGQGPAHRAGGRYGSNLKRERSSGRLQVGAGGLLGAAGVRPVREHTFHGDPPPKRS